MGKKTQSWRPGHEGTLGLRGRCKRGQEPLTQAGTEPPGGTGQPKGYVQQEFRPQAACAPHLVSSRPLMCDGGVRVGFDISLNKM